MATTARDLREVLTARRVRRIAEVLLTVVSVGVPVLASLFFFRFVPSVAEGLAVRVVWPWVPALEVSLSFYVDGLSLLFALLISIIGVLVALYASVYVADHPHRPRLQI